MGKKCNAVLLLIFMILLFGGLSSVAAATTTGTISTANRPVVKFETGYTVETVFDGSKLGIEPFTVEVSPSGDLLLLDSANSNMYKISQPLSRCNFRSAEGYYGHVDGRPREARMNHPQSFTVDDRGNIYVADTMNMAIRKIGETGVTTIAGGKWNKGGGHVDGPSEDAKFSNDFEVVYIGSSCSLLVVDRGNHAIREIQLNFEDCANQYDTGFPLGVAVLVAAGFFGYMLALLQRRVGSMLSSNNETPVPIKQNPSVSPYQKPLKSSVRQPLIPTDSELEKQEEGLFLSLGNLFVSAGSSATSIFGGLFSGFRKKPGNQHLLRHQQQQQQLLRKQPNAWPQQESFVIPEEDEPPTLENRTPTPPRKTYAFMSKESEKANHFRFGRDHYNGWDDDFQPQQQLQQQQRHQQQYQQRHYSSGPHTYYEQSYEATNEIMFGAVQEQDGKRRAVEIKAVDYGHPMYDHHNIRSRINYTGFNHDY
ncbi:hypothetical protein ACLOJK_031157 [Asimina triloba]